MRRTLYLLMITFSAIVLVSCIEINGSGYDSLTEQEKEHVKPCITDIGKVTPDGNLYKVKVEQVSRFIKEKRNVLVMTTFLSVLVRVDALLLK